MSDYGLGVSINNQLVQITQHPLIWVVDSFEITTDNISGSKTYDAALDGRLNCHWVYSGNAFAAGGAFSKFEITLTGSTLSWDFGSVHAGYPYAVGGYIIYVWYT